MQEKYEELLKKAKIDFDEIQKDYTKTQLVAKKNEDACFVIRNEKKDLETKFNNVVKENDEIKQKIARVKDNMNSINEKEKEVSLLKSQISTMRKEALASEKIRKEQDTETTLTDYYNDALNEYLLHVESLNCRLRNQVKNLQHDRRAVERDLVLTKKRCDYYQRRITTMESENRNLLYMGKLGNCTLDYKSSVSHTHHTTSNYQKERIDDSNNKRRSLIQGHNKKKIKQW